MLVGFVMSRRLGSERTLGLVVDGKDLALGVGGVRAIRALQVHFVRGELDLGGKAVARGPGLLPRLGLLAGRGGGGWTVHF